MARDPLYIILCELPGSNPGHVNPGLPLPPNDIQGTVERQSALGIALGLSSLGGNF